ncbi:ASCH domain-containing protein [Cronbergia sp. UHCC 0137]|uniref:ASCH domain-containing protein n=1 Tax=Cronbergia sp. UHCC 0137 TaxID=3110239 RepID=UPI002B215644|nr:ASCH domain-containing protein [Cronbergia sp. UHCC 0137]MEA5619522.1 ASCH domain-containing protein [Cronbergia sp. UHCC 0137]
MKALSLWQPWASLIPHYLKRVETRTWGTNYRGDLLICASARDTREQELFFHEKIKPIVRDKLTYNDFPFGVAVAQVTLVDCLVMTQELIDSQSSLEKMMGNWQIGRVAWVFENIRSITPFEVKGKQGLFDVENL